MTDVCPFKSLPEILCRLQLQLVVIGGNRHGMNKIKGGLGVFWNILQSLGLQKVYLYRRDMLGQRGRWRESLRVPHAAYPVMPLLYQSW